MIYKNFIFFLTLLFTTNIGFSNTIYLKDALSKNFIGKDVTLFEDKSATLTFDDIVQGKNNFRKSDNEVINFGITTDNNWIYFKLINNTNLEKAILKIPNPIIDNVTLYIVRKNKIDSIFYNNYEPLANREYKHQYYLFNIDLSPNEEVECYIKTNSSQQILAPITLKTDNHLISEISESDTKAGIYIGIMMVMFFYNLFIFFTVRDRDYLVYCHYIFWVCLTQATLLGYSHRFLWTENTWLASNMVTICGVMSGIATILFTKSFLKTKQFSKSSHHLLTFLTLVYLFAFFLILIGKKTNAFQIVNMCAATVSISIIIVAWVIYKKKNYTPAKYFLLSWSIFFLSILIFVAKDYSIVPYNQFTVHAVEIGSALEALFLSFALAGKINILKKEKEASQAESLVIAKENERIIREQNVILEQKVQERTQEILETNQELNITLEDLKQTQTQLVAAEKMASLGQLTAGIAHEINNPINFVTSNVSPLQRDVDMLLEAIETIENVGLSEKSTAQKQKEIEDYKEDLDFDYLKIEINHLLSGIKEGATRTAEIVKGLRIFSRVDEDDLKKASMNEGLDSTLVIMNSLLNQHQISVIKDYGDIPVIECYPGKLNQVFLNIISNAIYAINKQHNENGNGKLTIRTRSEEDSVFVTLKDNGIGMDEQTKAKIFDPFFTTKDVGEGTGLGMSITYNTIKKHNGEIFVNTALGAGTELIIKLPIYHENDVS
jgi:two-component system NtrC family sensor kinase